MINDIVIFQLSLTTCSYWQIFSPHYVISNPQTQCVRAITYVETS